MKKALLGLVLTAIGGVSTLLQAQTTPGSSAPATPVPMETPDPKLYGIPNTTPVGMPAYSITPSTGTAAVAPARRPMTAGDCDNGGWQTYTALSFKSQAGCRAWVKQQSSGTAGSQKAGTSSRAATPKVARTPAATPASPVTPSTNPTPNPH